MDTPLLRLLAPGGGRQRAGSKPGIGGWSGRPGLDSSRLHLCRAWTLAVFTLILGPSGPWLVDALPAELSNASTAATSDLIDYLLSNQDPRVRPNAYGPPVHVQCGIYVVSFGSINELDMEYTMDIYMRQFWQDPRLQHGQHASPVILPPKSMDQIWTPDLFFPNEKKASFHAVTVPNRLMRIYANGSIIYSVRITMTMACHMILTNFPMDYQECFVKVESYGFETKDMTLEWSGDAIEVGDELELPQFDLEGVETVQCVHQYKTGDFPCLKARFRLRRQFGFYLLQTYIPSILIVILSWVSFWINMDAVPARISLGVTTVLTMATQLTGSRQSIPKVSYPKAIDVWMSMCMVFVFSSLIEYAIVNVMARKKTSATYKKTDQSDDVEDAGALEQLTCEDEPESRRSPSYCPARLACLIPRVSNSRRCAICIDKTSRILFPGSFILFNIVYWAVYTQDRPL